MSTEPRPGSLTPAQRSTNVALLQEVQDRLEQLINRTPSGEARNILTDANIAFYQVRALIAGGGKP